MLMSTTTMLEGKPVSRYLGVVNGEAIIGANVFRDLLASVRDIVGGRSATYERGLAEARQVAMQEMENAPRTSVRMPSSVSTSTTRCSGRTTGCSWCR